MMTVDDKVTFRALSLDECDRISEIDTSQYIENAWGKVDGKYQLVRIDYLEQGWPDGYEAYRDDLERTISSGGVAIGAFSPDDTLIGYITLNHDFFGETAKYLLLDSLFVSRKYRGLGIGRRLVDFTVTYAKRWGADKLYTCAASSEETVAFYRSSGWVDASEINQALAAADDRDIQLEYNLASE